MVQEAPVLIAPVHDELGHLDAEDRVDPARAAHERALAAPDEHEAEAAPHHAQLVHDQEPQVAVHHVDRQPEDQLHRSNEQKKNRPCQERSLKNFIKGNKISEWHPFTSTEEQNLMFF